ncbi:MAG: apolipoprotein N-acyltransferase [Candidatus Sulfotelmatobacter sp.]|jgi:apolipoprotein N-acyltransferase
MRSIHFSAWLLVVLSALLQVLIFPLPGLYFLSWFALAPLILAVLRARPAGELEIDGSVKLRAASPGQAFLLAYVCGVLWFAGTCYWIFGTMRQFGGMSTPLALLALFLFCLYLGLYLGLFGLLLGLMAGPGRDYRRALVAAPFLWVATELARTRITGFPWNLLGTAQVDNVPLCRIATWTGVYGISCEIVLVNVAVAAAFLVPRQKRAALLVAALAAAAVLQSGRLVEPPAAVADREALLVQQNIPIAVRWPPDYFDRTLSELTSLTLKSAADAAAQASSGQDLSRQNSATKIDLIIWPESPAPFYTSDPRFRNAISDMAHRAGTWVVTGAVGTAPAAQSGGQELIFNSAAIVSPTGEWTGRYDKVHLVPFGEYLPFPSLFSFAGGLSKEVGEFEPGSSRVPLDAVGTKLGVFICYESVFPDDIRQFADQGAQVFVNISNDGWYGDSGAWSQHVNQTRMRAIENERWILSAANTGLTGAIDPYGRMVVRAPRKERTTLVAPYALTYVTTFYSRHGDWFAMLCAIISLAALIERFAFSKNRKKPETQES